MSNKTLSLILTIGGVVVFVAAILMGVFGFPHAGFGTYKLALAVVGVLVAVTGLYMMLRKKSTPKQP